MSFFATSANVIFVLPLPFFVLFFLFLITKILFLKKKKLLHLKDHKAAKKYKGNNKNYIKERSKSINIGRESLDVRPQTRDQSNKEPINKARS